MLNFMPLVYMAVSFIFCLMAFYKRANMAVTGCVVTCVPPNRDKQSSVARIPYNFDMFLMITHDVIMTGI